MENILLSLQAFFFSKEKSLREKEIFCYYLKTKPFSKNVREIF